MQKQNAKDCLNVNFARKLQQYYDIMIFIVGGTLSFFFKFLLLSKKDKSLAHRILTFWMFMLGLHLFLYYFYLEGIDYKYRRWIEEYIFSVRFNLNENWILKLETHINDGAAVLLNKDQNAPEIIDGRERYPYKKNWMLYAVKLSFSF